MVEHNCSHTLSDTLLALFTGVGSWAVHEK